MSTSAKMFHYDNPAYYSLSAGNDYPAEQDVILERGNTSIKIRGNDYYPSSQRELSEYNAGSYFMDQSPYIRTQGLNCNQVNKLGARPGVSGGTGHAQCYAPRMDVGDPNYFPGGIVYSDAEWQATRDPLIVAESNKNAGILPPNDGTYQTRLMGDEGYNGFTGCSTNPRTGMSMCGLGKNESLLPPAPNSNFYGGFGTPGYGLMNQGDMINQKSCASIANSKGKNTMCNLKL